VQTRDPFCRLFHFFAPVPALKAPSSFPGFFYRFSTGLQSSVCNDNPLCDPPGFYHSFLQWTTNTIFSVSRPDTRRSLRSFRFFLSVSIWAIEYFLPHLGRHLALNALCWFCRPKGSNFSCPGGPSPEVHLRESALSKWPTDCPLRSSAPEGSLDFSLERSFSLGPRFPATRRLILPLAPRTPT